MTVFKLFVPGYYKEDGETVIGFFLSEEVAREVAKTECRTDTFDVEPVNVEKSAEAFYSNKKKEIAKKALSSFSPEVQEALIAYIIEEAASKKS